MILVITGLIFLFGTEYSWWTPDFQIVSDTVMHLISVMFVMTGCITVTIESMANKIIKAIREGKNVKEAK